MISLEPVYPRILPDRDRYRRYFLDEDVVVTLSNGNKHTIPKGYRFDGHSIPRIFWFWFPAFDADVYAALVHDYLIDMEMFWRYNRKFQDTEYQLFMEHPLYFASKYRRWWFPRVVRIAGFLKYDIWGDDRGIIMNDTDYTTNISHYKEII